MNRRILCESQKEVSNQGGGEGGVSDFVVDQAGKENSKRLISLDLVIMLFI